MLDKDIKNDSNLESYHCIICIFSIPIGALSNLLFLLLLIQQKNLCQRSFISLFPEIYLQRKEIVKNCPMLKSADIKAIARQVALEMYVLNDEVLSLSDVATKLNKSEAAIKQMCYRGQLPFHKQLKTYYFSKNEITNFLLKKVNV
ncbi:MAG: helix-turn-helix domain-containing protein [Bacteroidaceae bacterium]|nr:helix-turn-helix domain-containing protein [Bacteroidaceae bacterium]